MILNLVALSIIASAAALPAEAATQRVVDAHTFEIGQRSSLLCAKRFPDDLGKASECANEQGSVYGLVIRIANAMEHAGLNPTPSIAFCTQKTFISEYVFDAVAFGDCFINENRAFVAQ